jgi:hypothetical protein
VNNKFSKYDFVINPETNRRCNIYSKTGQKVVERFLRQCGGTNVLNYGSFFTTTPKLKILGKASIAIVFDLSDATIDLDSSGNPPTKNSDHHVTLFFNKDGYTNDDLDKANNLLNFCKGDKEEFDFYLSKYGPKSDIIKGELKDLWDCIRGQNSYYNYVKDEYDKTRPAHIQLRRI